jgi:hypothetical protein
MSYPGPHPDMRDPGEVPKILVDGEPEVDGLGTVQVRSSWATLVGWGV